MPYVLLENGKIMQSANFPLEGFVFAEKEVVRAYNGQLYFKGEEPLQPEEEKLAILRGQKKKEAEIALTQAIGKITPHYPTDEKVSFAKQEEEALKYLANPEISAGEIPCIAGIAKGRQMELSELVQKIMYKANLFAAASGYYMGLKQRIEDLADAAQTEEEMAAIDVQAIFSESMGSAE